MRGSKHHCEIHDVAMAVINNCVSCPYCFKELLSILVQDNRLSPGDARRQDPLRVEA